MGLSAYHGKRLDKNLCNTRKEIDNMKRIDSRAAAAALAILMTLTVFTGCTPQKKKNQPTKPSVTQQTTAPTEKPTEQPKKPSPTQPTKKPTAQKPTKKPSSGQSQTKPTEPSPTKPTEPPKDTQKKPAASQQGNKKPAAQKPAKDNKPNPKPSATKQTVKEHSFTGYVTSTHDLNVREKPSVDAKRLGGLSRGTKVEVNGTVQENGKDSGWYRITYKSKTAYVSSDYVGKNKPEPIKEQAAGRKVKDISFTGYATSVKPDLNVRAEPKVSAKRLGGISFGSTVEVTGVVQENGKDANWYRIKYNGKEAYVAAAYVSKTKPSAPSKGNTKPKQTVTDNAFTGFVTAGELNVRADPNGGAKRLGSFKKGEKVSVTGSVQENGKDIGWYRIDYKGKTGYVSAKYITKG